MRQLRLDQAIRNLTCGDLEIPLVVIGLGVTGLKEAGFVYLLDLFGDGGRTGGGISCVGSLKSFDNSYIPCLLLIITIRFSCGERNIW